MSLQLEVPVTVARRHEAAVARLVGGFIFGLAMLTFVSIVIGALFLAMTCVGVAYEVYAAKSDGKLLEIHRGGLVVHRDFYERHGSGVRVGWRDVGDVSLVRATAAADSRYLLVELTAAARSSPPLDRFENGQIRVALLDAEPSADAAFACIDRYRDRFGRG